MNFGVLRSMVDNLVQGYSCPFCQSRDISDQHIDIVGAAGNTVNIDMHCPSCNKHFMAKTEVINMELGNITADKLGQIQESLQALKWKLWWNINIQSNLTTQKKDPKILDENIMALKKWMSEKGFSVEDLFGN